MPAVQRVGEDLLREEFREPEALAPSVALALMRIAANACAECAPSSEPSGRACPEAVCVGKLKRVIGDRGKEFVGEGHGHRSRADAKAA
jgi:hypothetical protein